MLKHLVDKIVIDVKSKKVYQLNISDNSFDILLHRMNTSHITDGLLYRQFSVSVGVRVSATKPILIEDITNYLHLII